MKMMNNYSACNSSTCIHGVCTSSTECSCNSFYEGASCDVYWGEKYHYMTHFMIVYATINCILQFLHLAYSSSKIYEKIKRGWRAKETFWTMSNTIFVGVAIAAFFRILAFSALDPGGYFGWMTPYPQSIFLFVPLWMWLNLAAMLLLCWVELTNNTKLRELRGYLTKLRPILYILMIASLPTIIFGLAATFTWKYRDLSNTLFSAIVALYGLTLAILTFVYGGNLRKMLKELNNLGTKEENHRNFMDRVTKFIIICGSALLTSVVVVSIFYAIGVTKNPILYMIGNSLFRLLEWIAVTMVLAVLRVKKSKELQPLD